LMTVPHLSRPARGLGLAWLGRRLFAIEKIRVYAKGLGLKEL
jgi:hypothetical protein